MFQQAIIPVSSEGDGKQYYEVITASTSGDYTINCGFKPKKIVLAGGNSGSREYPHNLIYDEDISDSTYKYMNSVTTAGSNNIGTANSEGPSLMSMTDAGVVVVKVPTGNRDGYFLAIG